MSRANRQHRTPKPATKLARELRKEASVPERVLWGILRNRRLGGFKFRRQVSFGRYVVDFYCAASRLVVELDGQSHDGQQEKDAIRTAFLESEGLRVIRVTNSELATNEDGIAQYILSELQKDR